MPRESEILRNTKNEHYRQQDRKIVKGRFQALRKVCVSPKATPRCARPLAAPRVATNEPIYLVNSAPESRPPIMYPPRCHQERPMAAKEKAHGDPVACRFRRRRCMALPLPRY